MIVSGIGNGSSELILQMGWIAVSQLTVRTLWCEKAFVTQLCTGSPLSLAFQFFFFLKSFSPYGKVVRRGMIICRPSVF